MKNNKIRYLLMLIFFCIFIFSLYNIFKIESEYNEAKNEYDELSNSFTSTKEPQTSYEPSSESVQETDDKSNFKNNQEKNKYDFKEIDFDGLTSLNSDVIAWITLPGTKIDYPIVHSKDNKEYLKLTFQKEYSSSGSIFMDKNNNDLNDDNVIIYGHNMKNGSMFKTLHKYKDKEFYNENKYFQIYTDDSNELYKIISCYYTRYDTDTYKLNFESEKEHKEWVIKMSSQSLYTVEDYDLDKNVITLSTCSGVSGSGDRFVVQLQKVN